MGIPIRVLKLAKSLAQPYECYLCAPEGRCSGRTRPAAGRGRASRLAMFDARRSQSRQVALEGEADLGHEMEAIGCAVNKIEQKLYRVDLNHGPSSGL